MMRIYNYELLKHLSYSMETLQLLSKIDEYKGKQDLYKKQSPQILETLKNVAIIQSTKSSNAIEGIIITNKRLKSIMAEQTLPMDRSEGEIAGYRNVLKLIHASSDAIPISPSIIKQLHRDLYEYVPSQGGEWKSQDNYISETLPNGEKFIRFIPVPAFQTDEHMRLLCMTFQDTVQKGDVHPLIAIAIFILDFLCIHPFHDGNGPMSRLLTLLLLYKFGYEVGRYISIEALIEESKETYYDVLKRSSIHWHEGKNDIFPWLHYFLSIIVAAYKKLEERVGYVETSRGNKRKRIKDFIEGKIGYFTKEEIRHACPDISEATINRVLNELKEAKKITPIGKGRSAKWKKASE
ncbi:Fic family protein [Anoxybacillus sp. LAT_35]|nr:Fic family protein [Anoxybacillus sp. LAT_11]MCG6175864.1 Fic family protein [Anoxybacillus sp. LAT_31]MCG6179085.1 Fic family protein [Anoxybacillus sp. LAT_35]MCG6181274.1 Fic family protein [Anoxybacillus sp. LAT_33]MCG6182481.1 Fic family protein [Anoxybacillus sp. LAT_26]MCG6197128.1 Fic family protein [Anoxybacillus sp. LAT_38]